MDSARLVALIERHEQLTNDVISALDAVAQGLRPHGWQQEIIALSYERFAVFAQLVEKIWGTTDVRLNRDREAHWHLLTS